MKTAKFLLVRLPSSANRFCFQRRSPFHTSCVQFGKDTSYDEQPHPRLKEKNKSDDKSRRYIDDRYFCFHRKIHVFVDVRDYMMDHEIYSKKELHTIKVTHKDLTCWQDHIAYGAVQTLRFVFDTFTGYVHEPADSAKSQKRPMTEKLWLRRIIFLESIAGVPGMVAGMSRHMKSLRKKRNNDRCLNTI